MLLLDRSSAKELLGFVSSIKQDIRYWGMIEIAMTGKTNHNVVFVVRKLEEMFQDRHGAIYIHDHDHILAFIKHDALAKDCAAGLTTTIAQTLPQHSCEVVSSALTAEGLLRIEIRLFESNGNGAQAALRSTLYLLRAERKENVILVADDNEDICVLLQAHLERFGECVAVRDSRQVLDVYLAKVPDIVFLDINFPGTSGLDVIDLLMKYDKDAHLIIMTGAGTAVNVVSAKAKGVKHFLGKPFELPRLSVEISRCPTIRGIFEADIVPAVKEV